MVKAGKVVEQEAMEPTTEVPEVDPQYRREQVAAMNANLPERIMSPSELHDIQSMDDALRLLQTVMPDVAVIEAREEIGDGFEFIENKDNLVGRPMLIVKWEPSYSPSFTGKDGSPLKTVQVWVVFEMRGELRKVRFTDFSTGVCEQLWSLTERTGRTGGVNAPKGLRKSEFAYSDPNTGQTSTAATYYIDLSREL